MIQNKVQVEETTRTFNNPSFEQHERFYHQDELRWNRGRIPRPWTIVNEHAISSAWMEVAMGGNLWWHFFSTGIDNHLISRVCKMRKITSLPVLRHTQPFYRYYQTPALRCCKNSSLYRVKRVDNTQLFTCFREVPTKLIASSWLLQTRSAIQIWKKDA